MKRRCGWFVICAVVAVAARAGLAGPVPWAQNSHSYEVVVVPEGITWADAQAAAVAKGGYLATLTSAEENLFVFNLMIATPNSWVHDAEWAQGAWLGGYQDRSAPDYSEPAGGWRWVTAEPWVYTNWLSGQPDNDRWNHYGEDYLCFFGRGEMTPTWNDHRGVAPDPQYYPQLAPSYVVEYGPGEVDTEPPTISSVAASPSVLWPPNHNMVPVTVAVVASDNTGVLTRRIVSVTSSEPDNGLGDGDIPGDIQITGDLTLLLRAERSGKGNGRTYTITVECKDKVGNAATSTTTVTVPRDQGKK